MHSANVRNFICSPKPRSFAALMEIYESNYIQLRRLCPALNDLPGACVSRVSGAMDLHLRIMERCRFTTTMLLTYAFDDPVEGERLNPNLLLRVYHDAHQVEVLSRRCRLRGDVSFSRLDPHNALECRWRLNRFLYKWLRYCRHQGHCFAQGTTQHSSESGFEAPVLG